MPVAAKLLAMGMSRDSLLQRCTKALFCIETTTPEEGVKRDVINQDGRSALQESGYARLLASLQGE